MYNVGLPELGMRGYTPSSSDTDVGGSARTGRSETAAACYPQDYPFAWPPGSYDVWTVTN